MGWSTSSSTTSNHFSSDLQAFGNLIKPTNLFTKSHPFSYSKAFWTSRLFTVQRRTLNTCLLCMYWAGIPSLSSKSNLDISKRRSHTPTTVTGDSHLLLWLLLQIPSKQKNPLSNPSTQILQWRNNPVNPHLSLVHPSMRL